MNEKLSKYTPGQSEEFSEDTFYIENPNPNHFGDTVAHLPEQTVRYEDMPATPISEIGEPERNLVDIESMDANTARRIKLINHYEEGYPREVFIELANRWKKEELYNSNTVEETLGHLAESSGQDVNGVKSDMKELATLLADDEAGRSSSN